MSVMANLKEHAVNNGKNTNNSQQADNDNNCYSPHSLSYPPPSFLNAFYTKMTR